MLKQRLITALVLVPLFVWGIISLQTYYVSIALALIILLGAWEWASLIRLQSVFQHVCYLLFIAVLLAAAVLALREPLVIKGLLLVAVIWWVVALVWINRYNRAEGESTAQASLILNSMAGALVLLPPWIALVSIHGMSDAGAYWVLFLMVIVWGADSGAYFAGRRWGSRKLAPHISPGKTWEGVGGALAATFLIAAVGGLLLDVSWPALPSLVMLSIVSVMFSIVGDLLESMFKRSAGVKDSGKLLPGHGGILDRIDSLTAAAPVFALGAMVQGVIA